MTNVYDMIEVNSECGDRYDMAGHKTEEVLSVKDKCRMGGFLTLALEPFLVFVYIFMGNGKWEMD
jgi:hypothetical protein